MIDVDWVVGVVVLGDSDDGGDVRCYSHRGVKSVLRGRTATPPPTATGSERLTEWLRLAEWLVVLVVVVVVDILIHARDHWSHRKPTTQPVIHPHSHLVNHSLTIHHLRKQTASHYFSTSQEIRKKNVILFGLRFGRHEKVNSGTLKPWMAKVTIQKNGPRVDNLRHEKKKM